MQTSIDTDRSRSGHTEIDEHIASDGYRQTQSIPNVCKG